MAPYSRALMQFAYAAMAAGRRVETFVFGTRLTRVTRTLRTKDPDRALDEIGRQVEDWEGGTRIGESLKTLLDGWSQRAALRGRSRGAVLGRTGTRRPGDAARTDGPNATARAPRRLGEPAEGLAAVRTLARGMAAALPSVDVFLSGHNLESLEHLGRVLGAEQRLGRAVGCIACDDDDEILETYEHEFEFDAEPGPAQVEPRVLAGGGLDPGLVDRAGRGDLREPAHRRTRSATRSSTSGRRRPPR